MDDPRDLNALSRGDLYPVPVPPGAKHGDWCRDYCACREFSPDTCRSPPASCTHGTGRPLIFVADPPRPDRPPVPEWVLAGLPGPI